MGSRPPSDDAQVTDVLPVGALGESKTIAEVMNTLDGDNLCYIFLQTWCLLTLPYFAANTRLCAH